MQGILSQPQLRVYSGIALLLRKGEKSLFIQRDFHCSLTYPSPLARVVQLTPSLLGLFTVRFRGAF